MLDEIYNARILDLAGNIGRVGRLAAPEATARHVAVLIDGAFSAMLVHRDPGYALAAGQAARILVAAGQGIRSPSAAPT